MGNDVIWPRMLLVVSSLAMYPAVALPVPPDAVQTPAASGPGEAAPEYPRVTVHELYGMTRNGRHMWSDAAPPSTPPHFVTVGILTPCAEYLPSAEWVLADFAGACCSFYVVGMPVRGVTDDYAAGDWIAVYGRLARTGPSWTASSIPFRGKLMFLGGDDQGIVAERLVPARQVIYEKNVAEVLSSESMRTFREILDRSDLMRLVQLSDAITLLVPHEIAFQRLEDPPLQTLLEPEQEARLRRLVLGHLINERLTSRDLMKQNSITMMNGDRHPVVLDNGTLRIGGARLLMKNLQASNGIVHIIMPSLPPSEPDPASGNPIDGQRYDPLAGRTPSPVPGR